MQPQVEAAVVEAEVVPQGYRQRPALMPEFIARFFDYLRTVHGLDFWVVSDNPKTDIPRLFSNSPELNCETEFWTVHAYSSVCIAKMNNMIVV